MPKLIKLFACLLIIPFIWSCEEETLPKPKAYLRLAYQAPNYEPITINCPFSFEISEFATAEEVKNCWVNIDYPKLRARVNLTYRPVNNNIIELLTEAEKLTYNHAVKADGISAQPYINEENKKFGGLSEVTGNAASPLQFHLTDSVKHFLTGSVYFSVKPNYDSILPAVKYIENDIKHLMESLRWK